MAGSFLGSIPFADVSFKVPPFMTVEMILPTLGIFLLLSALLIPRLSVGLKQDNKFLMSFSEQNNNVAKPLLHMKGSNPSNLRRKRKQQRKRGGGKASAITVAESSSTDVELPASHEVDSDEEHENVRTLSRILSVEGNDNKGVANSSVSKLSNKSDDVPSEGSKVTIDVDRPPSAAVPSTTSVNEAGASPVAACQCGDDSATSKVDCTRSAADPSTAFTNQAKAPAVAACQCGDDSAWGCQCCAVYSSALLLLHRQISIDIDQGPPGLEGLAAAHKKLISTRLMQY
jgi:hypothetical protein